MSPSSPFLAKKMLESIDFGKVKVIVELGPGTGVFTKKMLAKMAPDAIILAFELNDSFIHMLQRDIKDDRLHLIHDSAEKITEYLAKLGLTQADAVVSSLPLANFPQELKTKILQESRSVMHRESIYVQFQYSLNAKNLIKEVFHTVNITFTPVNFPPAFVYTCRIG